MHRWNAVARAFARPLSPRWGRLLRAFAHPDDDPEGPEAPAEAMGALEDRLAPLGPALPARIAAALCGEVDAAQAAMFARRMAAVLARVEGLAAAHPEGRLLRVFLLARLREILDGPPPRATRVRAVVDFVYSHAAALHHRRPDAPSLEAVAAGVAWRPVAEGLEHARVEGPGPWGPLHVNLLRARGLPIAAVRLDGAPELAAWASGEEDFAASVAARGALAGVSGGFFLYSEPDIAPPFSRGDPVGLLLHRGRVLSPALFHRSTLLMDARGRVRIERFGPVGRALELGPIKVRIDAANDPSWLGRGTVAFTRAFGPRAPAFAGAAVTVAGDRVVELAVGEVDIPLAGVVLALDPRVPNPWPGMPVTWLTPAPDGMPLLEGMAGGPRLVEGGVVAVDREGEDFVGGAPPITLSQDETFDENLLPRMVAGLTGEGDLVLAAVDGRNFDRAPGLTLRGTGALMAALGCERAMNLDGGSSKRMAVAGRVVDLPSTEVVVGDEPQPVRPVRTAVLIGRA